MSEKRVFISHSNEDQPLVESVLKWLQESEFHSAQIDDPSNWSADAGDDVRSAIGDKIRQADAVMLLWSDRAAKSAWVQYEVGMAQALGGTHPRNVGGWVTSEAANGRGQKSGHQTPAGQTRVGRRRPARNRRGFAISRSGRIDPAVPKDRRAASRSARHAGRDLRDSGGPDARCEWQEQKTDA
jgi:hypothetical protein